MHVERVSSGYLERVSTELDEVGVTDADAMGFLNEGLKDEEQRARGVKLSLAACIALSKLPGPATEARCGRGHQLTRKVVVWQSSCDRCGKELRAGQVRYGCDACDDDIDLCTRCAGLFPDPGASVADSSVAAPTASQELWAAGVLDLT